MSNYRRERKRPKTVRLVVQVALYCIILLAIVLVCRQFDKTESRDVFGSLNGRFSSDISLSYQGKTVHYRENEITNYLLIGVDQEELNPDDHQAGGQADFLLMLSIDRRNRIITPVMIDRDTMAHVPTYGIFGNPAGTRTMQICLAQAFSGSGVSGSENTAKAVSTLLDGVKIDRCLTMDLGGIALLNDAVGGVTVKVRDDLTLLDPALEKGAQVTLHGDMAEKFVRGRTTVADGTNLSRMTRQRTYIDALLDTMLVQLEKDSGFMADVLNQLSGHIQTKTDENILLSDVNAYKSYDWQGLRMLPGSHNIGEDGFAEFWLEEQAMTDMVVEIWFE